MTENTHGGANRGQGRHTLEGKPPGSPRSIAKTVTLTAEQWQYLIALGGGNASKGIRTLIEQAQR